MDRKTETEKNNNKWFDEIFQNTRASLSVLDSK